MTNPPTVRHAGTWGSTTPDNGHGEACYCGRPVKWHVHYGSGCGHVCGIHKNKIMRRKIGTVAVPLP